MKQQRVLIIVPAFNEARIVGRLAKEIQRLYPDYSVVIINDGSTDSTSEAGEAAGASVVDLPYNLGIGGAMQTGYKIAHDENYEVAVQLDGDGQHDPKQLMKIIQPVVSGEADLCIGSRFLTDNSGFKSTFARRIGISFFSKLIGILTGLKISDPTSGYRAISRKLILKFADHYPIDFPEPESILMAKRYRASVLEVPVTMRKRLGGISSIRYFKTMYYMFKVTLALLLDTLKVNK